MKTCEFCGVDFYPTVPKQRFCSISCSSKRRADIWDYLFSRMHVDEATGCWLWDGSCNDSGYGTCGTRDEYNKRVHRIVYELLVGPIPDGLCACHKCDVRRCANPNHIFLGTIADNQQDMARKNRMPFGEANPSSKLKLDQVKTIREMYASKQGSQEAIARLFNITQSHVYAIVHDKLWSKAVTQQPL